ISWPYSNAGLVLEQSSRLGAASNWQPAALVPIFDPASAEFSLSASTSSNLSQFFRLTEQADLRGIYVYVPLEGGPNNPASATVVNAVNLPGVDGMLIVGLWSSLETNFNQYDWSHLDKWISYAAARNKKVNLAIRAGDGIPEWLYLQPPSGPGATKLTFTISPK